MLKVKGSGVLYLGGKEIPFENKVNEAFVMAAQYFIDYQRLSVNYVGLGSRPCYATIFTLMSNPADPNMQAVYNRVGHIPINAFNVIRVSPRKTTIRGGGIITANATVRSAGFNVLCAETPVSGNMPLFNLPLRRVELRVDGISSVPYTSGWVYVPTVEALYWYHQNSTVVWKIPFNPETGLIGEPVMVTDEFLGSGSTGNYAPITDGFSKIVRLSDSTTMHMFDCLTDTASTVTLSEPVVNWLSHSSKGYDETKEAFISTSGSNISWFKPDGTVTQGTRESFNYSDLIVVKEGYTIDEYRLRLGYSSSQIGQISQENSFVNPNSFIPKAQRFPDSNGWILTGQFNTTTTPGIITLQYMRYPDTSMSIINIPPQEVEIDTPFTVDYTFEVTDTR